jgi:RNA polymerase sigma-70 factor, ECF subfamily
LDNLDLYLKKYRRSGDKVWFERIYNLFMPKVYRYYYYRTNDKHTAEDLSSELAIRVYQNLGKKKFSEKRFLAWIYRIAKNLLIDYYRKVRNRPFPLMGLGDETVAVEDCLINLSPYLARELGFKNEKLFRAMNNLTDLQKEVLVLKFIEGFDYNLISMITGSKENALRGTAFRALKTIKDYLNRNE